MIAKYNRKSLAFGLPGILIQVCCVVINETATSPALLAVSPVVLLVGFALLMTGVYFYVKSKGRNPAWSVLACFSFLGLIILACLKDHALNLVCKKCSEATSDTSLVTCPSCGEFFN